MTARHDFITFDLDPKTLSTHTWVLLGEAMSKCQHLAGVPLKPAAAELLSEVYLARGVQATTAIEGNTLSDEEVRAIVAKGSADVSESREYQQREVQNVLAAIRDIDAALREGITLTIDRSRLCDLNFQVLQGIPDKPEVVPGHLREHDVTAGPYLAPHWTAVPDLVERLTRWLKELGGAVNSGTRREDRFVNAVLTAVVAHLYIAWIHPFGNGNGRLARLVEVQILSESGVVPLVATNLLSDHYNKTRTAYYLALDAAQRDVTAFIQYAIQGFADELREQIKVVRQESIAIHWESYVYEMFRAKPSTSARDRQREVALALGSDQVVSPEMVTELTIPLARKYAMCGDRTPARDMNELFKMGLVERVAPRRFSARRELIKAFIPPVATPAE